MTESNRWPKLKYRYTCNNELCKVKPSYIFEPCGDYFEDRQHYCSFCGHAIPREIEKSNKSEETGFEKLAEVLCDANVRFKPSAYLNFDSLNPLGREGYRNEAKAAIEWAIERIDEKKLDVFLSFLVGTDKHLQLKAWLKQQWTKNE